MERAERTRANRGRLTIALGISAGIHAALFAWLDIGIPVTPEATGDRALAVLELRADPPGAALRVVPLESARPAAESPAGRPASGRAGGITGGAEAVRAASATGDALTPRPRLPAAAPGTPSMARAVVDPLPAPDLGGARRGVFLRAASEPREPWPGLDEVGEERTGEPPFGVGITGSGPGDPDCSTPALGVPLIPRIGESGGLPLGGSPRPGGRPRR